MNWRFKSEDFIDFYYYETDNEATSKESKLWYKAYVNENLSFLIKHEEVIAIQERELFVQDSNNNGCFIATACNSDISTLLVLYTFRDNILVNSNLGRLFIRVYYYWSPPIANLLEDRPIARKIVLNFIINPLTSILRFKFKRNYEV